MFDLYFAAYSSDSPKGITSASCVQYVVTQNRAMGIHLSGRYEHTKCLLYLSAFGDKNPLQDDLLERDEIEFLFLLLACQVFLTPEGLISPTQKFSLPVFTIFTVFTSKAVVLSLPTAAFS